ncbi:MAG: GNAT family N-acetyltransferase [Lachnospiraceae bacterium]|nr:GNAT family N-acetyltransferase [Lachnospiraceae bacterium]
MLKAIIFDMDGVIVDSEFMHARAALEVFKRYHLPVDLEYHDQFIGSSTIRMATQVVEEFQLAVSPEQLCEELNAAKREIHKREGYLPLPFCKEVIIALNKAGYKLAIASSSSPKEIENVVKSLNIRKYFHKLVSSSMVAHPKPAPDTFALALKELGVNASEAIVVEDSGNGVRAAKAAGLPCVGYVNPHSGNQDLSQADVLLESFEGITPSFFLHIWQRSHGEPITIGSTRRLLIRELTPDDIPDLYPIYKDPEVARFIDDIDTYKEEEMEKQKAYIRNVYSFYGYGLWGVFSKTTHRLIGRCGIENQMIDGKEEIMLSYLLDSHHWGYGYALECCRAVFTYAKEELGIHRIVAVIDKTNARSIKTATNLNMQPEKELNYKNRDSIMYSIHL